MKSKYLENEPQYEIIIKILEKYRKKNLLHQFIFFYKGKILKERNPVQTILEN